MTSNANICGHIDRKHKAHGLCLSCYKKYRRNPEFVPRKIKTASCHPDRKHFAKNLCQQCYGKNRYVDPNFVIRANSARRERMRDPIRKKKKQNADRAYRERNRAKLKQKYLETAELSRIKAAEYRNKNPLKYRESKRKSYLKYLERNRLKSRTKSVKYRKLNKQYVRNTWKEWERKNPDKVKSAAYKYRKNNPDKIRCFKINRRVRELNAVGKITPTIITLILSKEICCYCNSSVPVPKRTVEHVVPLSRGGSNLLSNLDMACIHCNQSKSNKTVEEFAIYKAKTS